MHIYRGGEELGITQRPELRATVEFTRRWFVCGEPCEYLHIMYEHVYAWHRTDVPSRIYYYVAPQYFGGGVRVTK